MRLTLIILLFIVLFTGCKKDKEIAQTNYDHHKISQTLYPFLFHLGSYWVFKDTITSTIDSTIVTSITKNTFYFKGGDAEYFHINYKSYPTNSTYQEELIGYVISRGNSSSGYTLLSSKQKGDKSQNAEITDVLDSLIVEGKTYHTVVKMKIKKDYNIPNNYNFYYVDSVGIIKKETTVNDLVIDTWNLLRYKTVMH